jgi:Zn-dependent protease with chaperone function
LAFFLYAQADFDAEMRDSILSRIRNDSKLSDQDRIESIQFFADNPMSTLITRDDVASQTSENIVFYYATFRWMIRISALSILSGIALLLTVALSLRLSLRSPTLLYTTLSAAWNLLRFYAALQIIAQGIMLVALSFWIPALCLHEYDVRLVVVASLVVVVTVIALIRALFVPVQIQLDVQGVFLDQSAAAEFWKGLQQICNKVDTKPPDHVIAGTDDNFFVTELPITIHNKTYHGRTLYVSLALLKQLKGCEAEAVLAHEMAHFSGKDTMYTKKTLPLLVRQDNYLTVLSQGYLSRPIFYFMLCFRALFEMSLRWPRFRGQGILLGLLGKLEAGW